MPLGTPSAGGLLVQFAPKTGATVDNPTAGEQVVIQLFDRARGVSSVACQLFNNVAQAPSGKLDKPLQGGEGVLYHADSGTFLRFHTNGDLEVVSKGKVNVTATGDVNVTTQGNATVSATGSGSVVNIIGSAIRLASAARASLHALVMDTFMPLFNGHTHSAGSPPDQQMTSDHITSVVTAQ